MLRKYNSNNIGFKKVDFDCLNITPKNFKNNYLKRVEKINFYSTNSEDIRSNLACDFSRIYRIYRANHKLAHHLLKDFKSIEEEFVNLIPKNVDYVSNLSNNTHKRQPTIREAIKGTLVRLDKLEKIEASVKNQVKSIIVGGSMSYGQFYNIRENLDRTSGSDIDLIFILDNKQTTKGIDLFKDIGFIENKEKDILTERMVKFSTLYKNGLADVLSKKFFLKDFDFEISLHIFPDTVFTKMIHSNLLKDLVMNKNINYLLRDYKDNVFPYKKCRQKSFSNKTYEFIVAVEKLSSDDNITTLPGYIIYEKELFTGIYQNLISPMFSVYLDNTGGEIIKEISQFKEIMIDRLHKEQLINKDDKFRFSHVRQTYFSPSVINLLSKY